MISSMVQSDAILESAAEAIYLRSSDLMKRSRRYQLDGNSAMAAEFRLRCLEGDECRRIVRDLKGMKSPTNSEKEMVRNLMHILEHLQTTGRQEYIVAYTSFTSLFNKMGGYDGNWPFPIQPATPPFTPSDGGVKEEKIA